MKKEKKWNYLLHKKKIKKKLKKRLFQWKRKKRRDHLRRHRKQKINLPPHIEIIPQPRERNNITPFIKYSPNFVRNLFKIIKDSRKILRKPLCKKMVESRRKIKKQFKPPYG